MAVLDRIRLTGPPADVAPVFDEKAGAFILRKFAKNLTSLGIMKMWDRSGSTASGSWFTPMIILRAMLMAFLVVRK